MYQIYKDPALNKICAINEKTPNGMMSIPIDPANTDYQTFKKEVLAGAELQDADGNVMTNAEDYVRTLP
jgi:hypothetical protein